MYPKSVSLWLMLCALLVLIMVVLGGLTRLTGSGLSMVSWAPITGWIPPFNQAQWQAMFLAYQQSPQFKIMNSDIDLAGFKNIFWLEFIHRLVGRVTGVLVLLPLLCFWIQRKIDAKFAWVVMVPFVLGAIQGGIGWYMVRSGLQNVPYVSQYWLMLHMGMACLIFSSLLCGACYSYGVQRGSLSGRDISKGVLRLLPVLIFLQILMGALVAGIGAGLIDNTFPDMSGQMIPGGLMIMEPWYKNIFENVVTVQFQHRMGAYAIIVLVLGWYMLSCPWRVEGRLKYASAFLVGVVSVQFVLGVVTLLCAVPVAAAALHQLMGVILFAIVVLVNYIA